MKKIISLFFTIIALAFFLVVQNERVEAKSMLNSKIVKTLTGEELGSIEIYDDGEIIIKYKYGLRRVDLFYCERNETCEYDVYSVISVVDSNNQNPYKNTTPSKLATFSYNPDLADDKEYIFRVETYFGRNSSYIGTETITGSPTIAPLEVLDTKDYYINGENQIDDEHINTFLDQMRTIINKIALPFLYGIIGMVLIVKGALLGTQIVKNADNPEVRLEKVKSLKWLVIGVAIAFSASTLVGVVTGFFENLF